MSSPFDICIRGSGVVGSTLALLLARQRLRVALVGQPAPATDVRAFALNTHSREVLSDLRCNGFPVTKVNSTYWRCCHWVAMEGKKLLWCGRCPPPVR